MDSTPIAEDSGRPRFQLRLLGRFELVDGRRPVRISPAGERLLAYLGIRPEPVVRPVIAASLWPDCPNARAAANLRSTLWRLQAQQPAALVCHDGSSVGLSPGVAVDLTDLSDQLRSAAELADIAVLRQDVLPGWPEEWLIATREWFRQIRLHALEALSDRHRVAGRLDAALDAGLAAVAGDPLRETAHRCLAQVHIAEGNFAEALRQYQSYRQLARTELGLPPSPHFRRLVAPLLGRPLDQSSLGTVPA